MKKIIYILLNFLLIAQGFSNAQEDKAIDAINNSHYIFDGTTCALDFIKDTSGKDFVSYKIIVNKVLKGNKQISRGDTIELISQMPTGWKLVDDPILGEILLSQTETIPLHYPYFKGIKLGQKTRGVYFVKADIFEGWARFLISLNLRFPIIEAIVKKFFVSTYKRAYPKWCKKVRYEKEKLKKGKKP